MLPFNSSTDLSTLHWDFSIIPSVYVELHVHLLQKEMSWSIISQTQLLISYSVHAEGSYLEVPNLHYTLKALNANDRKSA